MPTPRVSLLTFIKTYDLLMPDSLFTVCRACQSDQSDPLIFMWVAFRDVLQSDRNDG